MLNPYEDGNWEGDYSEGSELWTDEMKKKFDY